MGQQPSQLQNSEYHEGEDQTRQTSPSSSPAPNDDFVFSSQIPGSAHPENPFPTPSRRRTKFETTSSPPGIPSSSSLAAIKSEDRASEEPRKSGKKRRSEKRKQKKAEKLRLKEMDAGAELMNNPSSQDAADAASAARTAAAAAAAAVAAQASSAAMGSATKQEAMSSPRDSRYGVGNDANPTAYSPPNNEYHGSAPNGGLVDSPKKRKSQGADKSERKKRRRQSKNAEKVDENGVAGHETAGNEFGDLASTLYSENMMMDFGQTLGDHDFQTGPSNNDGARGRPVSSQPNQHSHGMEIDHMSGNGADYDIPIDPALEMKAEPSMQDRPNGDSDTHFMHGTLDGFSGADANYGAGPMHEHDDAHEHQQDEPDLSGMPSTNLDVNLGSEDLGLAAPTSSLGQHAPDADMGTLHDDIEVPSSVPAFDEFTTQNSASKPPRSKGGTGRKRVAKPSFQSGADQANIDALAELPSPAAAAATRKRRAGHPENTLAGPSNTDENGEKQPQFSSMLKADGTRPRAATTRAATLTGPFSEFENRNIAEAIERWRVDHNMSQFEINAFIQGNPKEVKSTEFWNRIIATCPGRRRQKVINLCRRKYHNFVARGSWTTEQHDELARMWDEHGNKFTLIGQLINRHPEDVRDRIRNYVVCGDKRRKDAWDQEEEDRLAQIVAEALQKIHELKQTDPRHRGTPDEDLIDWQLVSEQMDRTRSRLQCITKWKLVKSQLDGGQIDGEILSVDEVINRAREESRMMTSRDRYNVVKAIRASGANADSRIPWAKIRAEKVGNKWTRATLMVVWRRLKLSVPDWRILSVPEIADQLCQRHQDMQGLELPNDEDLDLEGEYEEVEHKISKILKAHSVPKTPRLVGAGDNDELAYEEDMEDAEGEETKMDMVEATQFGDVQPEFALQQEGPSIQPGVAPDMNGHDGDAAGEEEAASEAPSISDFKTRKTPKAAKDYGSVKKTPKSNGSERRKGAKGSQASPAARAAAKGKKDKSALSSVYAVDEASSDTNASDVESIPAHLTG